MPESDKVLRVLSASYDTVEKGIVTVENIHRDIHEGNVYLVGWSTTTLGNSSYLSFRINTSAAYVHLKEINLNMSAGLGKLEILESPTSGSTFTVGTTDITIPKNLNRNSTKTLTCGFAKDHTLAFSITSTWTSTQATILVDYSFGSTGTASNQSGVPFRSGIEHILKPATTYYITLYNISGAAGSGSINFLAVESTIG